ncbi:MAG: lactate utilization protein [Anaerolineae bacterium]|nr:lactate utilization protein [Anaerolineae bacterium]
MNYATLNYTDLATDAQVQDTIAAVEARGIKVHLVDTPAQALEKIHELVPAGAEIMTGGSQTLRHIGLEDLLISKAHPWVNLKDAILAENNPEKQGKLRAQSILAPYFLGSVHAISETGEIVIASGSGSQIPSYAFSSRNVIWVAGTQKIVPTLDAALKRVREYALPEEDKRMKGLGYPGSAITKLLIIEAEPAMLQRNVNLILVKHPVGV